MEIREYHSLGRLFIESFSLANRAFGRIIAYVILAIVGAALLQVLLLLGLPPFLIAILSAIYSPFFTVLLSKILAAQAEVDLASLPDLMSSSLLPAIYMLIFSLLCGIVYVATGLIVVSLSRIFTPLILVIFLPVMLFFVIRLLFAPLAIALREHNPISALTYSWELTRGHFFYVLTAGCLTILFPILFVGAGVYAGYVSIPLFFAQSFNLAQLSGIWWIVLVIFLILTFFVWLSMVGFWVLSFLNLDYTEEKSSSSQVLQAPQVHDQGTALSSGAAKASKKTQSPNVQILKASVKASSNDELFDKHLNEVYQPLPQNDVLPAEEDRMPTIVFDDEMAAQMAREREQWEREKNKSQQARKNPKEDGGDYIKMSK